MIAPAPQGGPVATKGTEMPSIFEGGKRMKRYSLGLVLLMVLALGTAAFANFPNLNPPDTTATFNVQQGFAPNGNIAWFFCTDTDDINFASTLQFPFRTPTLAAPLRSAYQTGLMPGSGRKMYFNVSMQQGPLFNAVPGSAPYAGVWSVVFIRFLPGQARLVCNTAPFNAVTNPQGFPITSGPNKQADLLSAYGTSQTGVVLDCPIVAIGTFPKSGPWFPGGNANANPLTFYRLPQVIAFNAYFKTVTLPAWNVYCQEFISRYIDKCTIIIPDVENAKLAARLKANLAPGLGSIDEDNLQDFIFIDGRVFGDTPPPTFKNGGPVGPFMDVNQFPIIEQCPTGHGAQNQNRLYTPLMEVDLFELTNPPDPLDLEICFVNNAPFADFLEDAGFFTEVDDGNINAPVLDCFKIVPPSGACCIPSP